LQINELKNSMRNKLKYHSKRNHSQTINIKKNQNNVFDYRNGVFNNNLGLQMLFSSDEIAVSPIMNDFRLNQSAFSI